MRKFLFTFVLSMGMLASCAAYVGPHGASVAIAPPLPVTVELDGPYYGYGGYDYYYHDDRWYCSQSRDGHWKDLPRDRYPKEVSYKGKGHDRDWKDDKGKGRDKDWNDGKGRGHGRD